jgi:putative transposase
MYKAYKFRLYPTNDQKTDLAKAFGCCRWYWNYSLNLCQETYKETGKGLSRFAIQSLLPNLKQENEWLSDAYSQCLQSVALNLSTAYKNFFEKRGGFPKFKSKHGRQSIQYPSNVKIDGYCIKLPGKVGKIYCKQNRSFEGKIKTTTVSLNPDGKYFVSILVDDGKELPRSAFMCEASHIKRDRIASVDGNAIGIDLGITHFAITSDGSKYNNQRLTNKHSRNLKKKQQSLARKTKGSNTRTKARKLVAKVHSKVKRVREDFLHKLSRKIVNENQVIVVENLNVKGMVCNHNLAKAISDCGWGQFCTMLKYKSEWFGKIYIEIDRWFPSSKTCNVCLNKVDSLPLDIRNWTCCKCNTQHDRDVNAAINIRNEGLRILSLGTRDTANGGNVRQPGKTSVLLDAVPCEVGSQHSTL